VKRFAPLLGAGLLALVVAACGSASAEQPSGPAASLAPDSPKIVAKDIAFTTKTVTAPAGKAFAIDFDNEDSAPHNVDITDASGHTVFRGDVFGGASHRVYSVPALAAGTYTFKCDVHPDMTGTLTVQ
jgi:plastocyanin